MSAPSSNRLVFKTPSLSSLVNAPLSDFESIAQVNFITTVQTESGKSLTCGNNCRIRYSWDYTPIIYWLTPAVVYPGMLVSVAMNAKNAPTYKSPNQYPVDIRIDDVSLDLNETYYDIANDNIPTNSF